MCIFFMNSDLRIESLTSRAPYTSHGTVSLGDYNANSKIPSAEDQILKFKEAHPIFRLRQVKTDTGSLSLIQILHSNGFKDLHASLAKKHDITVPELDPIHGVFEGIGFEKAESLLQDIAGDTREAEIMFKQHEARLLNVLSMVTEAKYEIDVYRCLSYLEHSIFTAWGFFFGVDKDNSASNSHSLVAGLFAVPASSKLLGVRIDRYAASFAESDGAYLTREGKPWYVQELKNLPPGKYSDDRPLNWKDLDTANIQDLHHLNGHPETLVSLTICQAGFKFRFRIPRPDSKDVYDCYQFPGDHEFVKFHSNVSHVHNVMFLRLMALIVFKSASRPVPDPGIFAAVYNPLFENISRPYHANIEAEITSGEVVASYSSEDSILINRRTSCSVTIRSYKLHSLPESLTRALIEGGEVLREKENRRDCGYEVSESD